MLTPLALLALLVAPPCLETDERSAPAPDVRSTLGPGVRSAFGPDEWLAGLEMPRGIHLRVNTSPMAFERMVEVEYFDMGFPEDDREKVEDAEARLKAGEDPARLLHQAAMGFAGLEESEKAWKALVSAIRAYDSEVGESPDDFDLRMSFTVALGVAGLWSGEEIFFEKLDEHLEAASQLEPEDARPGSQGAVVWKQRWFRAKSKDEDALDSWLETGLGWAEAAREADPAAKGGHWWCFELGFIALHTEYGEALSSRPELGGLVDELLEGCDQLEESRLLRFIGHLHGVVFQLAVAVNGDDETREELRENITGHMQGVMERVEFCERSQPLANAVGSTFWAVTCSYCGDDEDLTDALEQAVDLGLSREYCLGMATTSFIHRELPERATEHVELLEEELESDVGRAALLVYHYEREEFELALEYGEQLESDSATRHVQLAILQLRLGEHEEALDALEALSEDDPDLKGDYQHALGIARALAGDYEGAIEALEIAIDRLDESSAAESALDEIEGLKSAED
jgi:tetratricopeptide (TPR) repeat protein